MKKQILKKTKAKRSHCYSHELVKNCTICKQTILGTLQLKKRQLNSIAKNSVKTFVRRAFFQDKKCGGEFNFFASSLEERC